MNDETENQNEKKESSLKIKKNLLIGLIEASENTLPKEFSCLLSVNENNIIEEFVAIRTTSTKKSVEIFPDEIPHDSSIIGSFHSHPNGMPIPSNMDKKLFKKYAINIIAGKIGKTWRIKFFNNDSKEIFPEIIE